MSRDIFSKYGLDKIHDSLTENYDYKDNDSSAWKLVDTKRVMDSDGFLTDYTWYTNGDKHIFMFGDTDLVEPDEDYSDWEAETEREAQEWFSTYDGFSDESDIWENFEEDSFEEELTGNSEFLNDAFDRLYSKDLALED